MLLRRSLVFSLQRSNTVVVGAALGTKICNWNNDTYNLSFFTTIQHATRSISGLSQSTSISPSDIKICDLKEILREKEHGKECKTELSFIALEIQRKLRRVEKIVKAAPYAGGAFIQTYINEAREDLLEMEEVVKICGGDEKFGKDFVEKFKQKVEKLREDAKEVEYNADLI